MDAKSVGAALKQFRQEVDPGMTLNDVNQRTGISLVALSKYELGTLLPTDEHFAALSKVYNVSVQALQSGRFTPQKTVQAHRDLGDDERFNVEEAGLGRRRHRRGYAWENDEALLLQTVLDELKIGGAVKNACRKFAEQSGRALSSVTMYYFTNVRPRHLEELERAKREGKTKYRAETVKPIFKSPHLRRMTVEEKREQPDPLTYVALAMLKMNEEERGALLQWVQQNFTNLSKEEQGFASKTRVSFVIDTVF